MIFHVPYNVNPKMSSGSHLRPIKMLNAFKTIGYKVDCVMGYGKIRKQQIKIIKKNVKNGIKYDFLYSESSTTPTLLTEEHHFPLFPFLDFNFLKFCKKQGIKLGLYYRDIHWNFKEYKMEISFLKRLITTLFARYDLWKYKSLFDFLYLPSEKMYDYIPGNFKKGIKSLPPGISNFDHNSHKNLNGISFIYVGGSGSFYNIKLFLKVLSKFKKTTFYFCTREIEWKKTRDDYQEYLGENVKILHESGKELDQIYLESNVAVLFIKPILYFKFAMPLKLFEYIAHRKPIIAVKGTAAGDFVKKNNIGWVIEYDEKTLKDLIIYLQNNLDEIEEKIKNIEKIIPQNTWEARALQVEKDLNR